MLNKANLRHRLVVMLGILFGVCGTAFAKEVVFLTLEYPPYASESMPSGGAIVDVLHQALQGSEWQIQVRFVPWARVPTEIAAGHVDGVFPMWPEEVKAFGVTAGAPVFESRLGFYVRKADLDKADTSLARMAGVRVCTVRGYGYPDVLAASGVVRDDANDDEANLKRVTMGRCDFVAVERAVGEYLLSKNKSWSLNAAVAWKEPAFATLPLYIGVVPGRPDSTRLLADIEAGIAKMRKDGRFKTLMNSFSLDVPKVGSSK